MDAQFLYTAFKGKVEKAVGFLMAQVNKGNITEQEGSDLGDQIYDLKSASSIGDVKAEGHDESSTEISETVVESDRKDSSQ